jgi:hypothetical protein
VLLGLGVVAILAAAWLTGQASRGAAIAVTVGAAAWLALVLAAPRARRVALGVAAWVGVEGVSFAASSAARRRRRWTSCSPRRWRTRSASARSS